MTSCVELNDRNKNSSRPRYLSKVAAPNGDKPEMGAAGLAQE
ncbi:MAG: hypothetical protein ACI8TP_003873 [Acidimicrobiales bacterium]|jgi:hypothetical protein